MYNFITSENEKIKSHSLWRSLSVLESARPNEIILNGKKFVNFSSNDYLGLSCHPQVVQSGIEALKRYGAGARSSRLISGTLDLHQELERQLALFKRTESCLVFPTGFMANLGVLSALLGEGDAVIMDRLNHASLVDAAKLARCRIFVYEHTSIESLEKVLHRTKNYAKRLVVTDSLFSMDGDFAPLKEMADLCARHNVWLMIDDAHATGVLGENGIGMAEHFGLLGKIEIVIGTLSKALGSQGGFVCGSKDLIDYLINRARTFIYTTALAPAACASALTALELVQKEPDRRERLQLRITHFARHDLLAGQIPNPKSQIPFSPIIPFFLGSAEKTIAAAQQLKEAGIYVPAIRPPTVPKNQCRLRFSLTSEHTEEDIKKLEEALKSI